MKLPAYPKYKPSGVEWIGDVPETWDVKRTKWSVLGCINGVWGDEPNGVDDVTCVRVADFDRDKFLVVDEPPTLRAIEPNQLKTRHLRKGDLLIEKSGGGEKQLVGCVVSFTHDFKAVCSNFVARLPVLPELPPRYWCYVHAALYAGKLNYPAIKQTTGIQNLDSGAYLDTPAPFPPPPEQRSIAAFLDGETARIDRLVAKKKELIERLKEKRTALISCAVTRGLNPSAPFKSSGIDWLGDIPKHWEVKRLKFIFPLLFSGVSVNSDNSPTLDESPGILKTSCVYGNRFRPEENKRVLESELDRLACPVTKNSLIISRMNTPELVGSCGYVDIDYSHLFLPDRLWIARFQNHREAHGKFAWYLVISHAICALTGSLATGTSDSMKNLTQEAFLNIPVAVPPLPEQAAIAAYLDLETAKLDALVVKVEEAVERLQEYRTALITAAVTGKIDVRMESTP